MTTEPDYRIDLSSTDLAQAIEGLHLRATAWRKTAKYLRHGFSDGDPFICEECSDPEEACRIADHYDRIVASIEHQMKKQSGR